MNKRVGLYIRVSTQEQAQEGYSIGAQTERLEAYCKSRDWTVVNTYTDPGFSGAKMERPALQRMIKDIEKSAIDIVLVYKLDRLSRSQKDTLYLIEDVFLKNDVSFVSINENFDTSTAFGRAMIGILSVFAQLEREQIKERTSMGRLERAKDGYFHGGGFDPVGYDYIDGNLVVNEYEAMQVRKVFDMFLQGQPLNGIWRYMQSHYTTKHSSWSHESCVRSLLSTPLYTGRINYLGNLYPGRHEAIVTDDVYEQAQELLKKRTLVENYKNPFKTSNLLTGFLHCECCGSTLFAKGGFSGHKPNRIYKPYYTCYSRAKSAKHMIKDPNCKCLAISVDELDYVVVSEIRKLQFDSGYLYSLIDNNSSDSSAELRSSLNDRLSEIDKQERRLLDLYQLGTLPMNVIGERIDALNRERAKLQDDLDELQDNKSKMTSSAAIKILEQCSDVFTTGSLEQQKALLASLIDSITVNETDVTIHWKFA